MAKNDYGAQKYTVQENGKLGFDKVDLPFFGDVSLANMTQFKIFLYGHHGRLMVGIEGRGFYGFSNSVHPEYVKEKFSLEFISDARSVADFINGQFGVHNQFQENIDEKYL